jgi:hypothetical protein
MEKRWMPAEGIQSFSGEPETSQNVGHRSVKCSVHVLRSAPARFALSAPPPVRELG